MMSNMNKSLHYSKQNLADTCIKKIFDISQKDHNAVINMERIILQNKLKKRDNTS